MKQLIFDVLRLARETERSLGESGREEIFDEKVTDVAEKAERVISEKVLEYFKQYDLPVVFHDEEIGTHRLSPNPQYTIAFDDVDGTYNNMRGRGMLPAVSLVTVFDSPKPKFSDALAAGVIHLPTGNIWYVERGKGVEFNGRQTRTTGKEDVDKKTFIAIDNNLSDPTRFRKLYEQAWVRDYGSAGFHFAGLVGGGPNDDGMFDAYIHGANKAHELGAGYLFVNEGGGWIVDLEGNPFDQRKYDFNSKYSVIAAATEKLGRRILELIDCG